MGMLEDVLTETHRMKSRDARIKRLATANRRLNAENLELRRRMDTLTYKPAKRTKRPFKVGDTVEVIDRDHKVIGTQKIVSVGLQLAKTKCGRRWRIYDGARWADGKAWLFPSIRHEKQSLR